jgi:serine/threonine protein kinase
MPDPSPQFDPTVPQRPWEYPRESDPGTDVVPVGDVTEPWSGPAEGVPKTAAAPSLPDAITRPSPPAARVDAEALYPVAGQQIDDFNLLVELGRGAMGVVFLAEQISLGRRVALKVTRNIGEEARTMAVLEHRHIVQVFSESVVADNELRLLCMQFVPGVTLEAVIRKLRDAKAESQPFAFAGQRMLEIIDTASKSPALLDPNALRDRELLSRSDSIETVCWLGMRLAEALAYAHRRGVLHRDIKPANVLIDQYGHPRLADFSLAARKADDGEVHESLFGGTLNYMAPEHLQAFIQQIDHNEVGQLADIYSLALVLFEMLTLEVPGVVRDEKVGHREMIRRLIERRQEPPPSLQARVPEASAALDRTLRRALEPDPQMRFESADALAAALDGCRELRRTERALPPAGKLGRWCQQWPVRCLVALAILPHIAGSIVNISYNIWIVAKLNEAQHSAFNWLVLVYNALVYPVCVWALIYFMVSPAARYWKALRGEIPQKLVPFDRARLQALSWPRWGALWACIGWFPGALFFPIGLHLLAGPVSMSTALHFVASIALSGLVAITYSVVGLQYMALRIYYPLLWERADKLRETARGELKSPRRWIRLSQVLAGTIPLFGAILLVFFGPDVAAGAHYQVYQVLVIALIVLGMAGFQLALSAGNYLLKTIEAMEGEAIAGAGGPPVPQEANSLASRD